MTYDFILDRKSLILFLVGWIVIALLLFFAGWIVGMNWTASANTTSGVSSSVSAKDDTLPKEPVLKPDETQPASVGPGKAAESGPQPVKTGAGAPPQTGAGAAPPAKKAALSEAQIISSQPLESDSADAAEKENGSNESDYVTVQIGVFLDEKDASHLLKEMERKGYAPTFFSGLDAEARQWYAVRIGAYSDKQQAANAATNFSKQEKMKAVVRPLGSL